MSINVMVIKADIPRHPRHFGPIDHILKRLVQIIVFDHPLVRVIFTPPHRSVRPIRRRVVLIDENVLGCVPSAIAKIETTHERDRLVNDTHFLVLVHQHLAHFDGKVAEYGRS